MSQEAKREYLTAIRKRYGESTKKEKNLILNEFCKVCGFNRKYAIRILRGHIEPRLHKPGPKPKYDFAFVECLKELWEKMERICSKKMVMAIPLWLPKFTSERLTPRIRQKLLEISAASIDRHLAPFKHHPQHGLSTTRRSVLVGAIPIELLAGSIDEPGYVEADTVAHCGTTIEGSYANSLTVTDLFSGWTENRATWRKSSSHVLEAIQGIEQELPFLLSKFSCDNGTEFINHDLNDYFKNHPGQAVKFVRRRPYKKNDAAHVEQKNWTHVRQLFGYERLDDPAMVAMMNEIYRAYWNPLHNYFIPAMKLIKKERVGAKIKKYYDKPKTPCDRLLESTAVSDRIKIQLRHTREAYNPFTLQAGLQRKLHEFTALVRLAIDRQRHHGDEAA